METESNLREAELKLKELRNLLSQVESELVMNRVLKEEVNLLKRQIEDNNESIGRLRAKEANLSLLLNAYHKEFGIVFSICDECKGSGGYRYGEFGEEWEPCPKCEGKGWKTQF